MNNSADPQEQVSISRTSGLFPFLFWLASFIKLTDEERNAAGIYFGRIYDNDNDR